MVVRVRVRQADVRRGRQDVQLQDRGRERDRDEEHDKSDRGAEYSLLELFGGKLVTACDRTGNLDEIVPNPDFGTVEGAAKYTIAPVKDASGERIKLLLGDGKKPKPLKCEWSTIKDGKLVIGSTGKERTDDDGNVVHQGEMWCKTFDENWAVTHEDWIAKYGALRGPTKCPHGAGFMIHEGARWSDVPKKWFFIPRKLSREPRTSRRPRAASAAT